MRIALSVVVLFVASLGAHASSTLRVGSQVLVAGDTQERVVDLLGKPSSKQHSRRAPRGHRGIQVIDRNAGGARWHYRRDGHVIVVTIVEGRVTDIDDRRI